MLGLKILSNLEQTVVEYLFIIIVRVDPSGLPSRWAAETYPSHESLSRYSEEVTKNRHGHGWKSRFFKVVTVLSGPASPARPRALLRLSHRRTRSGLGPEPVSVSFSASTK
jgi:hypothetical protein